MDLVLLTACRVLVRAY